MHKLQPHFERILDLGNAILLELNSKNSDLGIIEEKYDLRGQEIDRINIEVDSLADEITDEGRQAYQKLLGRLIVIEKQLNTKLGTLLQDRKKVLQKITEHRQARLTYEKSAVQTADRRTIFDSK